MQVLADLQLHSRYSRAVSPKMSIEQLYVWGRKKGIDILATGDWTHPLWLKELQENLEEIEGSLLQIKPAIRRHIEIRGNKKLDPKFLLSGEVSCIYSHHGKTRRNHILLFAPSFNLVTRINAELTKRGCNITADGRPILGLSSQQVCEVVWSIDASVLVIPAHAWTPWFSLFGSISGYDSLEECFGPYASKIYAVETGLSSDPAMNWQIKELDTRSIVSFSDAHSAQKMMREATIFTKKEKAPFTYSDIETALKNYSCDDNNPRILATLEFYPEEGKYHLDGHRKCGISMDPQQTAQHKAQCPQCGRQMTVGVLHRIEDLASRAKVDLKLRKGVVPGFAVEGTYSDLFPHRPTYMTMVPLLEIIAQTVQTAVTSKKVLRLYDELITHCGTEFEILTQLPIEMIARAENAGIAASVERVRRGEITIQAGYDGEYGIVQIITNHAKTLKKQMNLFSV